MDEQLKELIERLDQLEQIMKTLKGQGMSYYINIEHADIQGPIVDKLDYNFDKVDVKEVSGALNLGNNFGVRVGEIKKKEGGGKSSTSGEKSKESPKQNEKGEESKNKKTSSDERKSNEEKTSSTQPKTKTETHNIEKKPASDFFQSNVSSTAGGQKENDLSKSGRQMEKQKEKRNLSSKTEPDKKEPKSDLIDWINEKNHLEQHGDLATSVVYHTHNTLKLKNVKRPDPQAGRASKRSQIEHNDRHSNPVVDRPPELNQEKTEGESRETPFLTKEKLREEQLLDKWMIKMGPNNALKLNIRGAPRQDKND